MNGNKNKRYIAKINTNEIKQLVIYFFFFLTKISLSTKFRYITTQKNVRHNVKLKSSLEIFSRYPLP